MKRIERRHPPKKTTWRKPDRVQSARMSTIPTPQDIDELRAFDEPFSLTIYAPFIDPNAATNPNRIELKNLLREATTALAAAGVPAAEITKTLRPARTLVDEGLWPSRRDNLVLYLHPKLHKSFYIPGDAIPYMLSVGHGFNLEPLLQATNDNQPYFVLALGYKHVRLFEGDRYRLEPVVLNDFPTDMKQSLNIDEYPQSRQTHAIAPASTGKGSEGYHQQYIPKQTDKDELMVFFRQIDRRLHRLLNRRELPLVIAGVAYLLPIYRKVNTYPGLVPEAIPGNQDRTDAHTLRDKAWQLVHGNAPSTASR